MTAAAAGIRRVLVIKLGALGDFVLSAGPFAAIRAAHPTAHVTLLTIRPLAAFAKASPWFDRVWVDERPKLWQVGRVLQLRKLLRSDRFDMVYDLQTSDRSGWYYHLLEKPQWSGIANRCSHPHDNPDRDALHTVERHAEQLAMAGLPAPPLPPDLSWVDADLARFALTAPYALLVAGGAAHRLAKRWPAERFAALGRRLAARGVTPVLLGTAQDADQLAAVAAQAPAAVNLAGRTDLADIAVLARYAVLAVGNDTGPMHLAAAAGCPAVVLFSAASNPALCAPRGRVAIVQAPKLADLSVEAVVEAAAGLGVVVDLVE